ncbi:MAG: lysine--tRNA ligase [Firmicutes bacterium]|nr:lysine--tRNA ligase [Bacillota bacterium]
MFWAEVIAEQIIRRNPEKQEYVCAAGISPSGSIHIGNFRDVATSYFVVKALKKQGRNAKLLFSWDEYDRLRKIPVNVAKISSHMEQYLGRPYVDVPNPFADDAENYARHFEQEFEQAMKAFGIEPDYRYQATMHRLGHYAPQMIHALKERGRIFDILSGFRTQEAGVGEREAYFPVSIYCPICGKDDTTITALSDDCEQATYICKCGYDGSFNFTKDFHCKLAWKVDWAMRWRFEGVDFEPGGKDHASPTGSYQTSKIIAQEIFGYEAPLFTGYEFIGIKGATGKMSGSSGLNLIPNTLLKLYQPEVILWLYAKTDPMKAFDFCFDDGILRQYFEFDKQYQEYCSGAATDFTSAVMENCLIEGRKLDPVPMGLLVQLGSVVDFNIEMLETVFAKIGQPYTYKEFADRLERARYWLEQCSPQSVNRLRLQRNGSVYNALSTNERQEIFLLFEYLNTGGYTLDDLQAYLYAIPRLATTENLDDKALKVKQGAFFRNVYKLLLDKEQGPRLYLFLYAIEKEQYLSLLDFSTPLSEYELTSQTDLEQQPVIEKRIFGEPDAVAPLKEEIDLNHFAALDLRVCRVLKCAEIRKSHSCFKLTLFDGLGEREIVSSIKGDYTPQELIGKKIIVLVNLKPARLTGVKSQGMLLAGTNSACGCQVIFVDESIPEGTQIK